MKIKKSRAVNVQDILKFQNFKNGVQNNKIIKILKLQNVLNVENISEKLWLRGLWDCWLHVEFYIFVTSQSKPKLQ